MDCPFGSKWLSLFAGCSCILFWKHVCSRSWSRFYRNLFCQDKWEQHQDRCRRLSQCLQQVKISKVLQFAGSQVLVQLVHLGLLSSKSCIKRHCCLCWLWWWFCEARFQDCRASQTFSGILGSHTNHPWSKAKENHYCHLVHPKRLKSSSSSSCWNSG